MDHFLKITYHASVTKKMNAYLKMPSPTYSVLKKEIEMCLFDERKQPRCEIRTFWIDEDEDEIEIINQCDYDIFTTKRSEKQHLQVAPIGVAIEEMSGNATTSTNQQGAETSSKTTADQSKMPPAAGSYEFAVHDRVECDACLMSPIIGFRYKCIQCPNFDLCQNCEAKHIHSEHMMVRMPTNNCPNIVEAYVTGRTSGRRHGGKRTKSGTCPFVVKNGLSVVIDDDCENAGAESGEQTSASPAAGKDRHRGRKHSHRRHQGSNFLSHLYEMMHDLAEGGGAAAAAAATGSGDGGATSTSSSNSTSYGPNITSTTAGPSTTFTTTDPNGTTFTTTVPNGTSASIGFENFNHITAASNSAQQAHEIAVKSAEIAAKVAHETALQAAKNITLNMGAPSTASATATSTEQGNDQTKEKVDATTSPRDSQPQQLNMLPSPSLETIAQFLDPQYMKTGIQILNNFSDMFAKMLDPIDGAEGGNATSCPFAANVRKNSAASSTRSSVSSNLNSMDIDKKSEKMPEKSIEKPIENKETKQPESDASSQIEIDDLGSDSENDSVSESFIKLDAPKEQTTNGNIAIPPSSAASATASTSAHTTPPQSLNKSNVMDFAQLSANLKAHIAEEADKNSTTTAVEIAKVATQQLLDEEMSAATPKITSTTTEPVATTTTTSTSTNTTNTEPSKPEEKRAVPVYHADQRINNSVLAMMSMGFSNEGAWLTQLLESVNGNIAEALDVMSAAQRIGH